MQIFNLAVLGMTLLVVLVVINFSGGNPGRDGFGHYIEEANKGASGLVHIDIDCALEQYDKSPHEDGGAFWAALGQLIEEADGPVNIRKVFSDFVSIGEAEFFTGVMSKCAR